MGFVIGVGLLLDTFIVRTVTVPATAVLVGNANWWPSKSVGTLYKPTTDATVPRDADTDVLTADDDPDTDRLGVAAADEDPDTDRLGVDPDAAQTVSLDVDTLAVEPTSDVSAQDSAEPVTEAVDAVEDEVSERVEADTDGAAEPGADDAVSGSDVDVELGSEVQPEADVVGEGHSELDATTNPAADSDVDVATGSGADGEGASDSDVADTESEPGEADANAADEPAGADDVVPSAGSDEGTGGEAQPESDDAGGPAGSAAAVSESNLNATADHKRRWFRFLRKR